MEQRKCFECDKFMSFEKNNMDDVIRFEKKYYHYDCFVNVCKRKSSKKNALSKWGEALNSIDEIKQQTKQYFKVNYDSPKDQLYRFLLEHYDVSAISPYTFIKFEEVYNGKRKGLAYRIPPEDLLDMWKQKQESGFLDRTRAKNMVRGINMTEEQKIHYDLAVLVGKYKDYLKWKEKNKIIEQEVNKVDTDILKTVDLDKLSKIAQNQKKEDDDDIDLLLDELFD